MDRFCRFLPTLKTMDYKEWLVKEKKHGLVDPPAGSAGFTD